MEYTSLSFSQSHPWLVLAFMGLASAIFWMVERHRSRSHQEVQENPLPPDEIRKRVKKAAETSEPLTPTKREPRYGLWILLSILFSAGSLLIADYVDAGWTFTALLHNCGVLVDNTANWLTTPAHLARLRDMLIGIGALMVVALGCAFKTGGRAGARTLFKMFAPTVELLRQIPRVLRATRSFTLPLVGIAVITILGQANARYAGQICWTIVLTVGGFNTWTWWAQIKANRSTKSPSPPAAASG